MYHFRPTQGDSPVTAPRGGAVTATRDVVVTGKPLCFHIDTAKVTAITAVTAAEKRAVYREKEREGKREGERMRADEREERVILCVRVPVEVTEVTRGYHAYILLKIQGLSGNRCFGRYKAERLLRLPLPRKDGV
jgi:hypothetical protein